MKSVVFTKSYINQDDIATLEFEIEMKTIHDPKGKFSIGFVVMDRKDGNGVKLGIFDDDRKIIGEFDDKDQALKILDKLIEHRKAEHVFHYKFPDGLKKWRKGPELEKGKTQNYPQSAIDGFILSKKILNEGVIPNELLQSQRRWRVED